MTEKTRKKTPKKKPSSKDSDPAEPLHTGVEILIELEKGLYVAKIGIDSFREQDKNARVMAREKFHQLTANIKRRGIMESLPYCVTTDREDTVDIISGHHRIRAARQAGLTYAFALLESNLSRDEVIAKQLAHNAIQGIDDKEILKQLFSEIQDLEARIETALDPKELEFDLPDKIIIPEMDLGLEFKHVSMMFLPHQLTGFQELIDRIDGDEAIIAVAPLETFDGFKKAVNETQKAENIVSIGTTIALMTQATQEYLNSKQDSLASTEDDEIEQG